jgi:hypothetical protein
VDWSNERYARLYTRDTVTWRTWNWEARAVFCLLLRKVDRSGVLDHGGNADDAIALLLEVPRDVASRVRVQWEQTKTVEIGPTSLVLPHFLEAQEAAQSDRHRQQETRDRRKQAAIDRARVTIRDENSDFVTNRHRASQVVTERHPSCAVPAEPICSDEIGAAAQQELIDQPTEAPKKQKQPNGTHQTTIAKLGQIFEEIKHAKYLFNGDKDGPAVAGLLKVASVEDICARWRVGLEADGDDWESISTVAQLRSKWNDLAAKKPKYVPLEDRPFRKI